MTLNSAMFTRWSMANIKTRSDASTAARELAKVFETLAESIESGDVEIETTSPSLLDNIEAAIPEFTNAIRAVIRSAARGAMSAADVN